MINSITSKRLFAGTLTLILLVGFAPTAFAGPGPNLPPNLPNPSAGISFGQCGSMDIAVIFDTTGSMGGAIGSVQAAFPQIIADANQASGNNFRMGLIEVNGISTFPGPGDTAPFGGTPSDDYVVVHWPLSLNIAGVDASIMGLVAVGGSALPEANDQGKATAIFNRDLSSGPTFGVYTDAAGATETLIVAPTAPNGFDALWNANQNIAILITDDIAGGFNDVADGGAGGVDDLLMRSLGTSAANHNPPIRMSDILVDDPTDAIVFPNHALATAQLTDDAVNSGGVFIPAPLGVGTGAAISEIIAMCGGLQIGGEILPISTTSLLVGGAAANAVWIVPILVGVLGTGFYFTRSLWQKSEE